MSGAVGAVQDMGEATPSHLCTILSYISKEENHTTLLLLLENVIQYQKL